jgi:hypothetical protein
MNKQKTKLTAKKKHKTLKHINLIGGYGIKTKSSKKRTNTRRTRRSQNNGLLQEGDNQEGDNQEEYTIPPAYPSIPQYVPPPAYLPPPAYVPPPAYLPPPAYVPPPAYLPPPAYVPPPAFKSIPPFQTPTSPSLNTPEEPEISVINKESFKPEELKNGFTETIIPNNQPPTNNNINVDLCATIIDVGKNINHKYMFPSQFPVITNFYKQIPENMINNNKSI